MTFKQYSEIPVTAVACHFCNEKYSHSKLSSFPASVSGGGGNLARLATSFDSNKLALLIHHNRWHECIQPHASDLL